MSTSHQLIDPFATVLPQPAAACGTTASSSYDPFATPAAHGFLDPFAPTAAPVPANPFDPPHVGACGCCCCCCCCTGGGAKPAAAKGSNDAVADANGLQG